MHLISEMDKNLQPINGIEDDLKAFDSYYPKIVGKSKTDINLGSIKCKQLDIYHKYSKIGQMQKLKSSFNKIQKKNKIMKNLEESKDSSKD